MPQVVLALDQGTTSSRAIVFDHAARPVAVAQQEFPQIYPQPGHVEHDPEAIWTTQLATAKRAWQQARVSAKDVAAIGVTNQRETTLLWNRRTGQPVSNAIVWQSRITADRCAKLKADGAEETIRQKTGLVTDAYFSGTKLAHLLDTVPGTRTAADRGELAFGTVDSFLIWRLTGGKLHITDASNASRTMLFNLHTCDWDDELLQLLNVPRSVLPEVRSSSEMYGVTDKTLFGEEIPIAGIAGDQQAATFGQACFEVGAAKMTYGTGGFLMMNTGDTPVMSRHGLLTTIAWKLGNQLTYALEGSIFIAGAAVQWLRDGMHLLKNSAETEELANSLLSNDGVYFVPAFVGLGAPYWDSEARGLLIGLTRGTTQAHLARAALESIAYQTRDVLHAMRADGNAQFQMLKVDGGAAANNWLMQFQADMLHVPVQRPMVRETTALGAAYLAGLATGFWSSTDDIRRNWQLDREFTPQMAAAERTKLLHNWDRAVERSRNWAN